MTEKNVRLTRLLQLSKDDPSDEFIMYAIAQEYLKNENYQDAINAFILLRSKNPKYIGLYYHLGACFVESGDPDSALSTYAEGISIARSIGDHHALSELQNARMNLELEL